MINTSGCDIPIRHLSKWTQLRKADRTLVNCRVASTRFLLQTTSAPVGICQARRDRHDSSRLPAAAEFCSIGRRLARCFRINRSSTTRASFALRCVLTSPPAFRGIDGLLAFYLPPKSLRNDLKMRPGNAAAFSGNGANLCANGHCSPPCTWHAAVGTLSLGRSMS